MTFAMITNPAASFTAAPSIFSASETAGRPIMSLWGCGGTGVAAVLELNRRLGEHPAVEYSYVETVTPAGISAHRCIQLHPEQLPHTPTPSIEPWLPLTGTDPDTYRRYVPLVGTKGLSQLPFMGCLAAAMQFHEIRRSIVRDVNAAATRRGGSTSPWLVTVSSAIGGTGAPSARVVGLAARAELGGKFQWLHVLVASSLILEKAQARRPMALEHQHLLELQALMRPSASLSVPGVGKPISPPGPDLLLVLASSHEAPRTLDECLDELAGMFRNWID